jgi:hypothetical protein
MKRVADTWPHCVLCLTTYFAPCRLVEICRRFRGVYCIRRCAGGGGSLWDVRQLPRLRDAASSWCSHRENLSDVRFAGRGAGKLIICEILICSPDEEAWWLHCVSVTDHQRSAPSTCQLLIVRCSAIRASVKRSSNSDDHLMFVTVTYCVLFEVRTEFINKFRRASS